MATSPITLFMFLGSIQIDSLPAADSQSMTANLNVGPNDEEHRVFDAHVGRNSVAIRATGCGVCWGHRVVGVARRFTPTTVCTASFHSRLRLCWFALAGALRIRPSAQAGRHVLCRTLLVSQHDPCVDIASTQCRPPGSAPLGSTPNPDPHKFK